MYVPPGQYSVQLLFAAGQSASRSDGLRDLLRHDHYLHSHGDFLMSECTCKEPGYCPNAGCVLNEHGFRLCREHACYRRLWRLNKSVAPCIDPPEYLLRRHGLGTLLAALIKLATFGYVQPCNSCQSRMAWLNYYFGFTTRKRNPNFQRR